MLKDMHKEQLQAQINGIIPVTVKGHCQLVPVASNYRYQSICKMPDYRMQMHFSNQYVMANMCKHS